MKNFKVAIIGECMVEFFEKEPNLFAQSFGGDSLNTAVYLQRCTPASVQVFYMTGLGLDKFSQQMIKSWENEGLHTDYVFKLPNKNPGLYTINVDATGERTFQYWRNDAAAKFWIRDLNEHDLVDIFRQFDMVYLSGISLAILPDESRDKLINALRRVRSIYGIKIGFDNNFRPALWHKSPEEIQECYTNILKISDYAFLTFDDEQKIWGDKLEQDCIERCHSLRIPEVVIKNGKDPCSILTAESPEPIRVAAQLVSKVVDTTAAGDSFSAGYLARRVQGDSAEQAADFAHKVAGTVIQHKGAIIPKALIDELL